MDLSITPRGVGQRGLMALAIDLKHVLIFPQANGRGPAAPNTTHTWPFLYIYLQNVLKFSVQRLANEARRILHASLALFFPSRCLVKCGRRSIQRNLEGSGIKVGVMAELVYKRTTKGHFVCRRASWISTCKFIKQWRGRGGEQISSAHNINNSHLFKCIHLSQLFFFTLSLSFFFFNHMYVYKTICP